MSHDSNTIGAIHREMMRRCYDPKHHIYHYYGAKGIEVCEEWKDRDNFRKWSLSNGYVKGLRLNRIDSSKNYCPENCFWGERNNAKHGYNEMVRLRAAQNKKKKSELGLKKLTDSPVRGTYRSMCDRCENPKHKAYKNYGGRGIKVCPEWRGKDGFYNFLKWVKDSNWSLGKSLDRIDVNKGYSPDNCRWATSKEQGNNKRNVKLYLYKGVMMNLNDISKMEGVSSGKVRYRVVDKGMTIEEAVIDVKRKQTK